MLEPCSRLMFLIGKVISSMVIVLLLKSSTIPISFMVSLPRMSVGVYIVMVCRWTDHILARNPLLEVEADLS